SRRGDALPAQAGRASAVQGPLSRRPAAGDAGGRPVAPQRARGECRCGPARRCRQGPAGPSGRSQCGLPEAHPLGGGGAALPGVRLLRLGRGRGPVRRQLGPARKRNRRPRRRDRGPVSSFRDPRVLIPFIVITLIWGSTWLVITGQLGTVPPLWSV